MGSIWQESGIVKIGDSSDCTVIKVIDLITQRWEWASIEHGAGQKVCTGCKHWLSLREQPGSLNGKGQVRGAATVAIDLGAQ